jgi:hypothetical protein
LLEFHVNRFDSNRFTEVNTPSKCVQSVTRLGYEHDFAAAAVAAALDEIKRAGGGVVEAYPEQTEERPPQRGAYLHTRPEELYARYGFTRLRKVAKWRWVMRTEI